VLNEKDVRVDAARRLDDVESFADAGVIPWANVRLQRVADIGNEALMQIGP
jgi:hypothetical protein